MNSFLHFFGSLKIRLPFVPASHFSSFKIGLMGGSFNPLHEGHIYAANEAMRRLRLDQIWLLVTPGNPLKSNEGLAPLNERLHIAQKKIHHRRMRAISIEEEIGTCYTSVVLSYLKGRYSRTKFVWIMGADNLSSLHFWNNWRFIVNHIPILIVDRPSWRFKAVSSPVARRLARSRVREEQCITLLRRKPPAWVFLKNRLLPHSSRKLRSKV